MEFKLGSAAAQLGRRTPSGNYFYLLCIYLYQVECFIFRFIDYFYFNICAQGLTGSPEHQNREEFIISKCWNASRNESEMVYYVEMSCNSMFGAGKGGFIGNSVICCSFPASNIRFGHFSVL